MAVLLFDDLYVIRENGVCLFSWRDEHTIRSPCYEDLITPLLTALDQMTNENFRGRIRLVEIEDGTRLYFKNLKISGGQTIKIIAVLPDSTRKLTVRDIDEKMVKIKWIFDKCAQYVSTAISLPPAMARDIKDKVTTMLSS